jgi:hypothetical protein
MPPLPTYAPPTHTGYAPPRVPAGKGSMIDLPQIKARLARIAELEKALGKEVSLWKARGGPLLPVEKRKYLNAIQGAVAGLDGARDVLAQAMKRLEMIPQPPPVNPPL